MRFFAALVLSALVSSGVMAADRSHSPVQLQAEQRAKQLSLPAGWQQQLKVGSTLDRTLFEASEVVYRDPELGLMTIQLEDKFVRVVAATHEILDVTDDF
ncbi:hypothetical protein [Alteromonas antoniana]|uniref:hypothetical protein n=1 Tax=Alteromonas antoniana TaxID=2803813 RepID=UPI001C477300|nr:hypothetical protein [Alteromonas antoniana]